MLLFLTTVLVCANHERRSERAPLLFLTTLLRNSTDTGLTYLGEGTMPQPHDDERKAGVGPQHRGFLNVSKICFCDVLILFLKYLMIKRKEKRKKTLYMPTFLPLLPPPHALPDRRQPERPDLCQRTQAQPKRRKKRK